MYIGVIRIRDYEGMPLLSIHTPIVGQKPETLNPAKP